MSNAEKPVGDIVYAWWKKNIASRDDNPRARALAARLRRGDVQTILCETEVHDLAHELRLGVQRADDLVRMVSLLAEVREHDPLPLARRLGHDKNPNEANNPIMSRLRFQRLMRTQPHELISSLRRAIGMVEKRCNVTRLAGDLLHWNENTRKNWCFQYFGAEAPQSKAEENTQ